MCRVQHLACHSCLVKALVVYSLGALQVQGGVLGLRCGIRVQCLGTSGHRQRLASNVGTEGLRWFWFGASNADKTTKFHINPHTLQTRPGKNPNQKRSGCNPRDFGNVEIEGIILGIPIMRIIEHWGLSWTGVTHQQKMLSIYRS